MNIENKISSVREVLVSHNLYKSIRSLDDLRVFMSAHVFAVWDFMSLAKRLQIELTCTTLPWRTPKNSSSARLINEIIFYEETDVDRHGRPVSHLEMYLAAMRDIGADTTRFNRFIAQLEEGKSVPEALIGAKVPAYIAKFVMNNIQCAMNGDIVEVVSSFLFAREDAIPDMFTLFLKQWGLNSKEIPDLVYYLERHIDLDGDEHGPAAHRILNELINNDDDKEKLAAAAAVLAIQDRISLWDGVVFEIEQLREEKEAWACQGVVMAL